MKKTASLLALCLLGTLPGAAKAMTGLYFSPVIWSSTTLYTDSGRVCIDPALSSRAISLMLSLYSENFFEINLHLLKDTYLDPDERDRYAISLEAGKLFSTTIRSRDQVLFSPDFAIGAFLKFNIMGSDSGNIKNEYGLYVMFKLRCNLLGRMFGFSSFDIGYKCMLPVEDNRAPAGHQALTTMHLLFFGISF